MFSTHPSVSVTFKLINSEQESTTFTYFLPLNLNDYRAGFVLAVVMKFIFLAAKTKNPKEKRGVGVGVEAETPLKWRYLFPPFFYSAKSQDSRGTTGCQRKLVFSIHSIRASENSV